MAATRRPSAPSPESSSTGKVTVPKLNRDPIQSLRPYSVLVTVAGHEVEIPALPAVDWLQVLMAEDVFLDEVFPGFLSEGDQSLVEDLILSGALGTDEYEQIILNVLEMASARDWWVALRLLQVARLSWDSLGADMELRGIDPTQVSLSRWLDVLLLTIIRNSDEKDLKMFFLKLEVPPEGAGTENAIEEMEMSPAQFMAMAQ